MLFLPFRCLRPLRAVLASLSAAVLMPAQAQPAGGEAVSVPSANAHGDAVALGALQWQPAGPPKAGVVLLHGSGGWSDHREGHWARALQGAGYLVLALDAFGARGIRDTVDDQAQVTALQMMRDALAARRWLLSRGLAAERLVVMGFSKGGTAALWSADRTYLPELAERFAVAIPFYPGCSARPTQPQPASVVFMALGEKDQYVGVKPCEALAADYQRAGGALSLKVYPGASHAFDGNPALTAMVYLPRAENYSACEVPVAPGGLATYQGRSYAVDEPALTAALRASCVKKGAALWTEVRQKAAATRDVIAFLDARYAR